MIPGLPNSRGEIATQHLIESETRQARPLPHTGSQQIGEREEVCQTRLAVTFNVGPVLIGVNKLTPSCRSPNPPVAANCHPLKPKGVAGRIINKCIIIKYSQCGGCGPVNRHSHWPIGSRQQSYRVKGPPRWAQGLCDPNMAPSTGVWGLSPAPRPVGRIAD